MMTVPTITKDSQQQDDVTTLPTLSDTSFTTTTGMNTITQAKCLVCTRSLFYLTTITHMSRQLSGLMLIWQTSQEEVTTDSCEIK